MKIKITCEKDDSKGAETLVMMLEIERREDKTEITAYNGPYVTQIVVDAKPALDASGCDAIEALRLLFKSPSKWKRID